MMDPALAAQLVRIEAKVDALQADVETLCTRGKLTADERELLARLLPMIAAVVGDAEFTVGDLAEIPTLASAIGTPKATGRLLLRAAGATIAGSRVERAGRDRDGVLWRLIRR